MRSYEFPENASIWPEGLSRRDFLRLAGASVALAGLGACTRQPIEKMVPFVEQPENLVPGRPVYYATAMVLEGFARGILVESHEGRPTKIEGNPAHPASLGATDVFMQATVRDLYDPSRSQAVTRRGNVSTKGIFAAALGERMAAGGVRILTEKTTSPTLIAQIKTLQSRHPDLVWHHYDPLDISTLNGHNAASGAPDLSGARIIVSLDANLFGEGSASLAHARQWADTRHIWKKRDMSRLYVAEPGVTITGAVADDRIAVRATEIEELARELQEAVAGRSAKKEWVRKAAADLRRFGGVVVAGRSQPRAVHEIAESLSAKPWIRFAPESTPTHFEALTRAMAGGEVETLLILGGNPARNVPVDLNFCDLLAKVPFTAHLSVFRNETSETCGWFIPQTHFLEDWGDARAFDGTLTIQQPLIEPLYEGMSPHEFLAFAAGDTASTSHDIVRKQWSSLNEDEWKHALSTGVVTEIRKTQPATVRASTSETKPARLATADFEINFRADPCLHDGRFRQNAWLQELADPVTKITWGNAVLLSEESARDFKVQNEDIVELTRAGRSVRGPVFVQTGHADRSITVYLGHGGEHGFDVYPLRTSDAFWFGPVEVRPTVEKQRLITTQHHYRMEGRELVRLVPAASAMISQKKKAPEESLYPPPPLQDAENQWGMAIDLSTCFGCNACVVACQAENNIPVVGPEQVAKGREMQWIRIDTYFEDGKTLFQPVPCMHCENAPCELVCPVAATMHDSEGLNVQVYNRCIGTRYCSNNCPYKVRRFNFLEFNRNISPSEKLLKNPNVTVRSRGVMEKCTYCIQRISAARIEAKKADRLIRDGEVIPACAQACPAEAITFGNIRDPASAVSKLKALPLNYSLLAETNVRPRTTYLARVTNQA
jgi:Fe-S-cluster-containing dehydrogenase component